MPTDANGVYTLPPSYFVQNGDPIQPVQHNPPLEDLQQGMTDRVMRDGRAALTGPLNFDGNKAVGLAQGTAPGEAATFEQAVPAGAVMAFARNTAPTGWLPCRGQSVSRTTFAGLFAAIGTTFGAGDGSTTFGLPNLRGQFIRGWNETGSGLDINRIFGSDQGDLNKAHSHGGATASAGAHTHTTDSQGSPTHTGSTDVQGSHSHTGGTSAYNHDHGAGLRLVNNNQAIYGTTSSGGDGGRFGASADSGSNGRQPLTSPDSHSHSLSINAAGAHSHNVSTSAAGAHTHTALSAGAHTHTIASDGGAEVRPYNIALLYCIKT